MLTLFIGVVGILLGVVEFPNVTHGAPSDTWSNTKAEAVVSNGDTISDNQFRNLLHKHNSIYGTTACTQMSLDIGTTDGSAPSKDMVSCWYTTGNSRIPQVMRGGYEIRTTDKREAGYFDSSLSQLFPTANPDVFIQAVPASEDNIFSYYLYFRTGDALELTTTSLDDEGDPTLNYTFINPPSAELTDLEGKPLIVDDNFLFSQINYSDNGKWMSIWGADGLAGRVDLTTFKVSWTYVEPATVAKNDYLLTSMSPSGRYMALNDQDGLLRVIDFNRCSQVTFDRSVQFCSTRYVSGDIEDFAPDKNGTVSISEFINDDLLAAYVAHPDGSYYQYIVRAPGTWKTDYIALGDSFASGEGEGNATFYPETDIPGVNMCHLSKRAYPFELGERLSLDSVHSVACSGAKLVNVVGNGVYDRDLKVTERTNQYTDRVPNNSLGSWLPGFHEQIKFVKDAQPHIITISMAGNDIGFKGILERCLGVDTCYGTKEERLELMQLIDSQYQGLVDMYQQLKQSTVEDARIYVVGYPSIIKSNGDCGGNVHFNAEETVFANQLMAYLNDTIQAAAKQAGVFYVDTTAAFNGHRLCEGTYGYMAVNGITFGHDTLTLPLIHKRLLSSGSFHPTTYGHELLANRIEEATDDFTAPMPRADKDSFWTGSPAGDLLLQVAPSGHEVTAITYADDLTNDVVVRGIPVTVHIAKAAAGWTYKILSTIVGWLHSDPVDLGSFQVNADGSADITVTIPKDVPAGFHTIGFTGEGTDGKKHTIEKTVYVAASSDDYDGDGVENQREPCLIFEVPADQTHGADYTCDVQTDASQQTTTASAQANDELQSARSNNSKKPVGAWSFIANAAANARPAAATYQSPKQLPKRIIRPGSSGQAGAQTNANVHSQWRWVIGSVVVITLTFLFGMRYAKKQ
ncbi:MAG TPA: SGNH/GDSL hydrolase family protein [Candidatus Saccharimonadales bacterium]|nr:SGNH/GDSL hydrolase family protein [Candidatus Saccharimonadales bacterium]